ncbi:MAG: hypothetical protein H7641_04025, partial [Candidatus Heimdallarchaeota archaeon]|nr:hypothetical protein [Candidatus Heimdallarchaeota archaeon]MCK4876730.1 hypothetical protein [Candidatus Heimdallarchaeota archaeon]
FDPASYVDIGENIFRIKLVYDDELTAFAPDNLKYINNIEALEFTVLNPIEDSWASGIIDPQAIATGGYKTSIITYDFALPGGSVVLENQTIADNIDSTLYADQDDYEITFYVSDALGQSAQETRTFGIDNLEIDVNLSLNSSVINPGDFLDVSWIFTIAGAQLINQTLVMGGDVYGFESVYTSISDATTNYVLTGPKTASMAEDELTFTIFVKDEAGNTNSHGQEFSLIDNLAPVAYFITPVNNSFLSEYVTLEVYATDASGIDTSNFDVRFEGYSTSFVYLYQNSVEGDAVFIVNQNKWVLEFNTYLLPDDNYSISATVFDLSIARNTATSTLDIVEVDNDILNIYGAAAINGRGGFFFRRRGVLTFYVQSMVPTTLTITQMKITWYGSGSVDLIYEIYDDTIEQYWLPDSQGPILDDVQFPVAQAVGGINMTSALDHHLTVSFDYGDRPEGVDFAVSFYILQLDAWETLIIDSV